MNYFFCTSHYSFVAIATAALTHKHILPLQTSLILTNPAGKLLECFGVRIQSTLKMTNFVFLVIATINQDGIVV